MTTIDTLYTEVKPDIAQIATPLFDFSEQCLRKTGNFLPHAAVLTAGGEVRLVGADTGSATTNSTEVLPILHEGLRKQAATVALRALGVAENVTVTLDGQCPTKAIKVLFEHQRGLTVALYLPFEKKFLKGYVFGSTFSLAASPEVDAWPQNAAQPFLQADLPTAGRLSQTLAFAVAIQMQCKALSRFSKERRRLQPCGCRAKVGAGRPSCGGRRATVASELLRCIH